MRDWECARNEGCMAKEEKDARNQGCMGKEEREAGLRRAGEHRKKRGECITKFHRIIGRMPPTFNYENVSVGEQKLCKKYGKEVGVLRPVGFQVASYFFPLFFVRLNLI